MLLLLAVNCHLAYLNNSRRGTGEGIYSKMTSTGVLRTHLIKFHAAEYLEACQKNGWQPKGMVKELNSATSGDLDELPRLPFTKAWFRKALVEWIVGLDESINVVESRLFRNLLLTLRESMQDKDIPR
ncbi:hypothetical protein M422DRAFT_173988 [Sphaerobolus stellatus SS14]|uniref:Uncharacterized protein n=1 Tax=Sphaerobolus stellatus (strain SS14) TaxID=990650 RepID=A0A0C9UAZ1_SPHS4|nr:hypothetical protein M422DRAFT_173988 [Sphaerobolus stellatus SS14]